MIFLYKNKEKKLIIKSIIIYILFITLKGDWLIFFYSL